MVVKSIGNSRARLVAVLMGVLLSASGCGVTSNGAASSPPMTPAQAFNAAHGGKTVTPYGRVVEGSAADLDNGYVQYRTDDGRKWKVRPVSSSETPEEVP